jgi:hypothetical protein
LNVSEINLIMKKIFILTSVLILVISCSKGGMEPIGPTDVRIRNHTTVNMTNLTVNSYDSTFNYGSLKPDSVTAYYRFDRAYPSANISALINGIKYKTDTAIYTYQQYMGQMKITYVLGIQAQKLIIEDVVTESGLK